MKKMFLIAIVLLNCLNTNAQNKKYMSFQAEIANRFGDEISFYNTENKLVKKIQVNKDGFFKDTLNVVTGRYRLAEGNENIVLYLKNGFDLKLKMDNQKGKESIVYAGQGAVENDFLIQDALVGQEVKIESLLNADETDFFIGLNKIKVAHLKFLESKKMDPAFVSFQKQSIDASYNYIVDYYKKMNEAIAAKNKLKNTMSPSFDYINHKGGKTKLADLIGKYVYIDVWATWCGPCRVEIPYLQKIEEEYHDKNIAFVSISIDVAKDFEKWKTFVTDKNLGGIQLLADKDWNSDFIVSYGISGIPRFILIDPMGKVVNENAARPSDPELRKVLDQLLN
ncbi:TlpA family protein disulfide reductase [Flavobacterium cellulosilyticum]|uniref:TlpA family protein disulfide reductase n=1 Tax=Flavobacterium cellulosilyticum TaxID=2541731 RepID=A0A4V2Z033_9FLAO|nr:TlpA disulfide reductase family protein [Flavobacterium cellulosilyticum]TDD99427.1 TlpA family protein disulfide reductase [Flavobacterium cellulosilyticum]